MIEQPDTLQHNGMTNSETEMYMWNKLFCYEKLETAFLEDEKSTTLTLSPP